MRKTIVWKLIGLALVVCAAMLLVEVLCQLPLFSLPEAQKGDIPLDAASFTVVGGEEWSEDWDEEAPEEPSEEEVPAEEPPAELYIDTAEQVLTIPYEGYLRDLTLLGYVSGSQRYTVTCLLPDGGAYTASSVFLEALGEDSVFIGREVAGLEIAFSMGGASISGATVRNGVVLNPNRMLLVGLTAACAYVLIAFRHLLGKKQEYAFLAVALAMGLFLSIGLPTNVNLCFDDEIHVGRVFALAQWSEAEPTRGAELLGSMSWSVNEDNLVAHRLDTLWDERALAREMDRVGAEPSDTAAVELHWSFSDTGYLTQALGVAAARLLGQPLHVQVIFARAANMLTYVLLCFLAVKALRRFKLVMACAALMPAAMFQACSLSYDPTGTALCHLGIALAVDAMLDRATPLRWTRALGILLCFVVGSLTKIVYIPLLLLTLLLPRSKFAGGGQRVAFKAAAVALCLAVVLAMVANVSGGGISLQDNRGPGADSGAQIAFILSHPLTYLGYFFATLWEGFSVYFMEVSRVTWGYIGSVSGTLNWLSLGLVLFTAFTDNDPVHGQRMNWRLRLAMLVIAGLVVGMVFTTMYVAFSPVGVKDFSGVQARYLIPVLPLMLMLVSPEGIHNRMNKAGWTSLFGLINLLVLAGTGYQLVCLQFFH